MTSLLKHFLSRLRPARRPALPDLATEETEEVLALARVNTGIEWATESTSLLIALRDGLTSIGGAPDRPATL